jgi:hypothetical protein
LNSVRECATGMIESRGATIVSSGMRQRGAWSTGANLWRSMSDTGRNG